VRTIEIIMDKTKKASQLHLRPPIVTVLGHVDHGKTTLLDTIRKTNVTASEHGGITQHIGAYQISFTSKDNKDQTKKITFIDTPGHEAFIKMRQRGTSASDITLLVIAADDGVKPQTIESIKQIHDAKVPMIVVINKIDLPDINLAKIKQDLARNGVQVEGFGGEVPIVTLSAKSGQGVIELLELINLLSEMKGFYADPAGDLKAQVVETRMDKGKGIVATVIVKNGILKVGMSLFDGSLNIAKIRAFTDDKGIFCQQAFPSQPVEVMGFTIMPQVGAILTNKPETVMVSTDEKSSVVKEIIPNFLISPQEEARKKLKIIIKSDTAGTLEAILAALNPKIVIVSSGVGPITEKDVLMAKSTQAIVIAFNSKISGDVEKLAVAEKVIVKSYKIIYELLDEMQEVIDGIKEVLAHEKVLGQGQIIAEFPFNNEKIAGIKVISGRMARGDNIKIMRSENEIGRTKIKSIRKGKENINKIESDQECGIQLEKSVDFLIGDVIISFTQ